MKFIKNNLWTILSLALVVVFGFSGEALAQTSPSAQATGSVDQVAMFKARQIFMAARNIMFIIGGLGLVAVAFGAIAGKMNWKWVGALAIGLALIAAATAVIDFATSDMGTGGNDNLAGLGDTLGNNQN